MPLLLGVAVVNYVVDPGHVFSDDGLERRAAMMLLRGENVVIPSNYDERSLQKEFVSRLQGYPKSVVLGSSRGMLVDRRNGSDNSLVNSCVSGARFEHMIAIYQLYVDRGIEPQYVIMELSPYMLNGMYQDIRYRTLDEEYHKGAVALGQEQPKWFEADTKYLEIVSLSYFQSAVRVCREPREENSISSTRDSIHRTQIVKFPDGSIAYSEEYRNRGVGASEIQAAADYGNGERFVSISVERQKMFGAFITYLQGHGVKVEFLLTPFPEEVLRKKPVFRNVEAYVRSFASQRNIPIRGSYDCTEYDLAVSDFYDGLHLRKYIYDLIMGLSTTYILELR